MEEQGENKFGYRYMGIDIKIPITDLQVQRTAIFVGAAHRNICRSGW
jgi:hypothetical protein